MALSPERAGHLQHPLVWTPDANHLCALRSEASLTSSGWRFGALTCDVFASDKPDVPAFLSIASVHSGVDQGVGGLFKMAPMDRLQKIDWFAISAASATSGALASVVHLGTDAISDSDTNSLPALPSSLSQLEFEAIGDDCYIIRLAGTNLALTGGPSAGEFVPGPVYFMTYDSSSGNQIWKAHPADSWTGYFDFRPIAAPDALAIGVPSDSNSAGVSLALSSPRQDSSSQTLRLTEGAPLVGGSRMFFLREARGSDFFWTRGESVIVPDDSGHTIQPITQARTIPADYDSLLSRWDVGDVLEDAPASWRPPTIDADFPTIEPRWHTYYRIDTRGADLVPLGGGVWANSVYYSADRTTSMVWVPTPRDTFDAELPTPMSLEIEFHPFSDQDVLFTNSLGEIPPNTWFRIYPHFDLAFEWHDLQATLETRYLLPSGEWSPWSNPQVPNPLIVQNAALSESRLASPDWHIAWVPDSFATLEGESYKGTEFVTQLFEQDYEPSGQVWKSLCPECQVRLRVRCFRYNADGVPVVGPTAACTVTLSKTTIFELAPDENPRITRDGLEIPFQALNIASPMSLAFSKITIEGVEAVQNFRTSISRDEGIVLIPWASFRELDASWFASRHLIEIDLETATIFSHRVLRLSGILEGDPASSQMAALSTTTLPMFTIAERSGGTVTQAFCVAESETEQRVIEMPVASGRAIITPPAFDVAEILDAERQPTSRILVFSGGSDNYLVGGADVPRPERAITTLMYKNDEGVIISAIEGNVSFSYAIERDILTARSVGDNAYRIGSLPGGSPSIELSGTLFRGQLASWQSSQQPGVQIVSSIQRLFRISPETTCILRTAAGSVHLVRIVGISAPRGGRDLAEVTIQLVEVTR